ncbi:MAG: hypothetical protein ACLFPE_12595, partial [Bacteroidales bacterium]
GAFRFMFPVPSEKTHKIVHSKTSKKLHKIYQAVREIRESKAGYEQLPVLYNEIRQSYPDEWLLPLEILELTHSREKFSGLSDEIRSYLIGKQEQKPELVNLISNGLSLIGS